MIRNIAATTNPGLEKDALVIYTDANNVTPFAPEWLFSPGVTGSRDFNGTTDKIVWASVHDLTGHPVTVAAWVYFDAYAHSSAVLCANNVSDNNYTFYFLIGTDGAIYLYRNGTTTLWRGSSSAIGTGGWRHIVATHDGTMTDYTTIRLYKNGIDDTPQFNGVSGAGEFPSTGKWCVGNRDYDNARGVDGKIAQLALWDRVLTQAEITGLASGIRPNAYPSNLLYYFPGETSSLVANPPNTTGTATGTTWSSTGPTLSSMPITMTADLGDGTWLSHTIAISKLYGAGKGRHKIRLTCPDWSRLTQLNLNASVGRLHIPKLVEKCHNLNTLSFTGAGFIGGFPSIVNCKLMTDVSAVGCVLTGMLPTVDPCVLIDTFLVHSGGALYGPIPNPSTMTSLVSYDVSGNRLWGACPSFAFAGTNLVVVEFGTQFLSGALPSFASNPNITLFSGGFNLFSGDLPDFSLCTKLTNFEMSDVNGHSGFTTYVAGSFATQRDLTEILLDGHEFPSAAINNILADCVTSLGIGGRVTCTVDLRYGTNGAPTGQGITDKATLIAAGWTVYTN